MAAEEAEAAAEEVEAAAAVVEATAVVGVVVAAAQLVPPRPSLNLLHLKEQVSLKCLSHGDSAIAQLVPSKGTNLTQVRLPLRLGNSSTCSIQRNTTCSIQRNKPRSSASPTGTRQSLNLFHPKEQASLKCLSHWNSAIAQLVPSKGTSLAQVPLPLGLSNRSTCSIQRNKPRSIVSPAHQAQIKARSLHKCPP
ncbi:hypothetical protein Adt_32541 [Abeliophyllum distichum]|uniref:Uncharacterized protein n=1 Tax=Abeliophyllum distichum TaxID=126358 RepID=A0ABD1QTQ7_9LAMI